MPSGHALPHAILANRFAEEPENALDVRTARIRRMPQLLPEFRPCDQNANPLFCVDAAHTWAKPLAVAPELSQNPNGVWKPVPAAFQFTDAPLETPEF